MNRLSLFLFISLFFHYNSDVSGKNKSDKIEIYSRCEFSFKNTTWIGNPFDLEFDAEFVSPSGRILKQPGFYAGNKE